MYTTAGLEPARSSLRRDVPGRAARRGGGEAAAAGQRRGGGEAAADDLACVCRLSAHVRLSSRVHGCNVIRAWGRQWSVFVYTSIEDHASYD
jgi:hypothetical protein